MGTPVETNTATTTNNQDRSRRRVSRPSCFLTLLWPDPTMELFTTALITLSTINQQQSTTLSIINQLQSTTLSTSPCSTMPSITVFAPTNEAFNKVPSEALAGLLANKEELKAVLLRHVVPSTIQGKNIPPGTTALTTAGGEEISVTRDSNNLIQIQSAAGSAYVVLFDVIASNGVVHAVDSVF